LFAKKSTNMPPGIADSVMIRPGNRNWGGVGPGWGTTNCGNNARGKSTVFELLVSMIML
jgi:hypothetical protein